MSDLPFHTPLSPAQQRTAGLSKSWTYAFADKVRFAEIDPLNHVNNVAYLTWFESARVGYFRHIGLSTYTNKNTEPRIVIRRGEMDWLQEMHADDEYVVTAKTIAFRNTSFSMAQEIWSGGTKRAAFESVIVLLIPDGSARMPIPQAIRSCFEVEIAT